MASGRVRSARCRAGESARMIQSCIIYSLVTLPGRLSHSVSPPSCLATRVSRLGRGSSGDDVMIEIRSRKLWIDGQRSGQPQG
jgi:hypothetical protein